MNPIGIRTIYAVNFSIIMSLVPIIYILNHPNIFKIGFDEDTIISLIPMYPITFIVFKNIARFLNGFALLNDYIFGKDYNTIIKYFIIFLIFILTIECYQICFSNQFNVNIFAFTISSRQYLYGSIDYSLDQLDDNYNQNYRVIGLIVLLVPLFGIINKTWIIESLKLFYAICIISLTYCIYLFNIYTESNRVKNKPINIKYAPYQTENTKKRISINKFAWIFVMLILVSYIDGAGDALATEKLWNSKTIDYFLISSIVRILSSLLTFPPIQNKIINNNNINISNIVTKFMVFRFILLISMKWTNYKQIIYFTQCSIDIFIGTIFMNDYLNKNKKIFLNSTTNSKYYISSSIAYFINENVPPFIKIILVTILTSIGKKIEIGLYFTLPIIILAIGSIKLIPFIQNKIKKEE